MPKNIYTYSYIVKSMSRQTSDFFFVMTSVYVIDMVHYLFIPLYCRRSLYEFMYNKRLKQISRERESKRGREW